MVGISRCAKGISGVCDVMSKKFMRTFVLGLFLYLRNEGIHILPWGFGGIVVDVVRLQLGWLKDWFWRRGSFCTVLDCCVGVDEREDMRF